ncbi:unnamed protein product [Spirodela intermedia]|uniref:Uncharacterized protein n=1 Tax=Spirodela intermedia TaxID=51605 RepID=A0A7I8K9G1_SPIIN|nr:unnamed protein product [Spirodela intermedia]
MGPSGPIISPPPTTSLGCGLSRLCEAPSLKNSHGLGLRVTDWGHMCITPLSRHWWLVEHGTRSGRKHARK